MVKIDKGIPIPSNVSKYPWADLKIGDSFLAPGLVVSSQISATIRYQRSKRGHEYRCKKEDDGLRIWRIK